MVIDGLIRAANGATADWAGDPLGIVASRHRGSVLGLSRQGGGGIGGDGWGESEWLGVEELEETRGDGAAALSDEPDQALPPG